MEKTYRWDTGWFASKLKADVAGAELEALQQANGGIIRPEQIVDVARPKTAPLHPAFEWNDRSAAESWRREQARKILHALHVEICSDNAEPVTVRAYVCVPERDTHRPVFTDIQTAVTEPDWRDEVLADLRDIIGQAEAILGQYRALISGLDTVEQAMTSARTALAGIVAA